MNWKSLAGAITLSGLIGGVSGYVFNQGHYGPVASNYPISFNDAAFKVNGTAATKTLFALSSARQKLTAIVVDPQTAFAGTGITGVTCSVGTENTRSCGAWPCSEIYAQSLNVMQTAESVSQGGIFSGRDLATPDSSLNVVLHCTAVGASFGNGSATVLTQGAFAVTVYTATLPGASVFGTPGIDAGPDAPTGS